MVIVIVAEVLAFVFRDTNKNESQEHQFPIREQKEILKKLVLKEELFQP
jgi:hypothetical protein